MEQVTRANEYDQMVGELVQIPVVEKYLKGRKKGRSRILDVGCGEGHFTRILAKKHPSFEFLVLT